MVVNERELLNINDAAKFAKVSRRTIYHWIKNNKIEYERVASGRYRIYKDTLYYQDPLVKND